MMSQSRCTLSVRGLDCPNEVEALRAALEGSPGIARLGFDLINGLMTVDYAGGAQRPRGTGPAESTSGPGWRPPWSARPEAAAPASASWWSRHGRLGLDGGSPGWRWAWAWLVSWLGTRAGLAERPSRRLARGCFVSCGLRSGGPGSTPAPCEA